MPVSVATSSDVIRVSIENGGMEYGTTLITIIISSLTLLSYYLALGEYYSSKAYWEFYHIHKKCRRGMRSGFHAEYLSIAAVILVPFGVIAYSIIHFWETIQDKWEIWCMLFCAVTSGLSYIVIRLMLWKMHMTQYNERIAWKNKDQFAKYVKMVSGLFFKEYGMGIAFMICGIFICIASKLYIAFVPLVFCTLIYMQFQSYSRKLRVLSYKKWMDIVEWESEKYAVIEEYNDSFYLIKCEERLVKQEGKIEEKELELLLDEFVILKTDSLKATTKYYTKISRKCNSKYCDKCYIIGLRDDL